MNSLTLKRGGCLRLPFDQWGEKTDGGAPWAEWYDLEKLFRAFDPVHMETVLSFEFFLKTISYSLIC